MPNHIIGIGIGEQQLTRNEIHMRELEAAMSDILHENQFLVEALGDCEVNVTINKQGQRVIFCAEPMDGGEVQACHINLPTKPLRGLMRDYFIVCESYQEAIRSHDTRKIEAVDMGRRGLHNEGAEMITDMLDGKVSIDHNTARRLFTLVAIMHMK